MLRNACRHFLIKAADLGAKYSKRHSLFYKSVGNDLKAERPILVDPELVDRTINAAVAGVIWGSIAGSAARKYRSENLQTPTSYQNHRRPK